MLAARNIVYGILLAVFVAWVSFGSWCAWRSSPALPHDQGPNASYHGPQHGPEEIAQSKSVEDRLAKYTLWLAIFTGALVLTSAVQNLFLIRANKTARIAAEAAKQSADAIPTVERPFVFVRSIAAHFSAANDRERPEVTVTFHNYGRTPANVHAVLIGVRILDHIPTEKDAEIYLSDEKSKFEVEIIFGADQPWTAPVAVCWEPFTPELARQMTAGKFNLYCWGFIEYRDIFGRKHSTRFCRQYELRRNEWFPVGGMGRNRGD
jgi:hypothetical protein